MGWPRKGGWEGWPLVPLPPAPPPPRRPPPTNHAAPLLPQTHMVILHPEAEWDMYRVRAFRSFDWGTA